MTSPQIVLMWEVRAAPGRFAELLRYVDAHAPATAQVFCSGADDRDERVVVIDPSGTGLPDVPSELIARPAHVWPFQSVSRSG